MINKLSASGLDGIEVGSFVSPKWVPQMADSAQVLNQIEKHPGVRYSVLVPNTRGMEAAVDAGAKEVAIFVSASESFNKKNINATIDETMLRFKPVMEMAKAEGIDVRGYVSCVVGCPYDGTVKPREVARVAELLMQEGCYEISLGDTIGVGNPGSVVAMLREVKKAVPVEHLAAHFHDTYGQALVNLLAAAQEGISVMDTAVSGLGGCPYAKGATGNVATEDVLYMLAGLGIETGVSMQKVMEAGNYISEALGRSTCSRTNMAIARKQQNIAPQGYKEVLKIALVDGILSPEERNQLYQYRMRHNVSQAEHIAALMDLGMDPSEYVPRESMKK